MASATDLHAIGTYSNTPVGMIRAGCVHGFETVVERAGGSPQSAMQKAGLSADALSCADNMITLQSYARLLDAAAAESGLDDFGMALGEVFDARTLGPIGYLFRYANTWGDALSSFCKYFAVVQDDTVMGLEVQNGEARITYELKAAETYGRKQDAEFSIALLCHSLLSLSTDCEIRSIDFQHDFRNKIQVAPVYRKVEGGQPRNAIYLSAAWLESKPLQAEGYTYNLILQQLDRDIAARCDRTALLQSIRKFVADATIARPYPSVTAAEVATALGVSERTLHRRLISYGTNFRDLRNLTLAALATDLLAETRLSISEIGYRLGYSESSAFSRAFKSEVGKSPQSFRARLSQA